MNVINENWLFNYGKHSAVTSALLIEFFPTFLSDASIPANLKDNEEKIAISMPTTTPTTTTIALLIKQFPRQRTHTQALVGILKSSHTKRWRCR